MRNGTNPEGGRIAMNASLTERQQEVYDLVVTQGIGAREAAERLGITRNAVYQNIQAIRKKGLVIGGEPPPRINTPERAIAQATGREHVNGSSATDSVSELIALVRDMQKTQDELVATIARLTERGAQ